MLLRSTSIILCLSLFITFNLFCQNRTEVIRGVTFDSGSGKKIANVKIYPDYQNDTVYSRSSGKFKIRIPANFRGNIQLEHPGYYPYQHRIKNGRNLFLQTVGMITNSLAIDTIFYPSIKENRQIEGLVLAKDTKLPIINAAIWMEDHKRIGYSNNNGIYKLCIPKATDNLMVTHSDYYSYLINIPGNLRKNPEEILMEPLKQRVPKDSCFEQKNSLRLITNSLLAGAVAIDYERFLKHNHSVGLKSSFYIYHAIPYLEAVPFSSSVMAEFTGIKLSPYYRYYLWRNFRDGGFIEGKISWGYFDFEKINYFQDPHYDPEDQRFFPEISNSFGFGGSFGWMFRPHQGPVILNLSIGAQYFALNVPETKQIKMDSYYTQKFKVDDLFWYLGGPGSYFEIKFMIGGIF